MDVVNTDQGGTNNNTNPSKKEINAFVAVLILLPVLPWAFLAVRDVIHTHYGWAISTPAAWPLGWEITLVTVVCWASAAAVWLAHRTQASQTSNQ